MSKRNKRFALGLGMLGAGLAMNSATSRAEQAMRAQWERDNEGVPPSERHPEWVNFDPLVAENPERLCGLAIGDAVHVKVLDMFEGNGEVVKISTVPEESRGTKLHPMFLIKFDDRTAGWFARAVMTPQ